MKTENVVEGGAEPEAERRQEQPANSAERPVTPKNRGRPSINTASLPETPPNLTDTPTTFVTPPTPTSFNADASTFPKRTPKESPGRSTTVSSVDSIKHRRAQSANLPSKLSQSIPPPLTPTVEETKTPGGTLTQPASASGFFSSVFSAAQKAADQLSNSINTSIAPGQKTRLASQLAEEQGSEEVIPGSESQRDLEGEDGETRAPAVETLGEGDLSFSHLGISDSQDPSPMTSTTNLPVQNGTPPVDEANKRAEEEAAARAVSVAYEKPVSNVVSQATGGRPLSIASNDRLTLTGEQTPPRSGNEGGSIKRSGSVRSRISEHRQRRHRASSATAGTANSITAGLTASATGLSNLTATGQGHRLTGFAVASSKRNKGLPWVIPERARGRLSDRRL